MKISPETLTLLENFVAINTGIVIKKTPDEQSYTTIKTINREAMIYAEVQIPEVFTNNVCLYDLKQLISTIKALPETDIELHDDYMVLKKDSKKVKIIYSDAEHIIYPKKGCPKFEKLLTFNLSSTDLKDINYFANTLNLPNLRLYSEDGILHLQALQKEHGLRSSNQYDIILGPTDKENVDVYFKCEYINKLILSDYIVSLTEHGIEFKNAVNENNFYFIGMDLID